MENLDPEVRDVYTEFGLAVCVAQSLEWQLVLLIIAGYEPPLGKLTAEVYDDLLAQLSQQTLGTLIRKLRDSFDVPIDFDQQLHETLHLRNWLTHHYFADRTAEFQSTEGRSKMIRELDKISDRLHELDEYFDHLLVNWLVDPSARTRKLIEHIPKTKET